MSTIINYSAHNQNYIIKLTVEECRNELINFGYPESDKLTDKECLKAIFEIYEI
jgi:hypothetical protein